MGWGGWAFPLGLCTHVDTRLHPAIHTVRPTSGGGRPAAGAQQPSSREGRDASCVSFQTLSPEWELREKSWWENAADNPETGKPRTEPGGATLCLSLVCCRPHWHIGGRMSEVPRGVPPPHSPQAGPCSEPRALQTVLCGSSPSVLHGRPASAAQGWSAGLACMLEPVCH